MSSIEGFRILIAEDDASLLKVMASFLRKRGAVISEANNGQEAADLLSKESFDLVLSDVQMPIMTGIELLVKIREKHKTIPVVLLVTGQAQVTEAESMAKGAIGLVQKPFKLAVLVAKLEGFIAAGELKRSP